MLLRTLRHQATTNQWRCTLQHRRPLVQSAVAAAITQRRLFSLSRALATDVLGKTKVDQTRESNDPAGNKQEAHQTQARQASEEEQSQQQQHPAKQPDPQPNPSKSTGIREEGPGGEISGRGAEPGHVYQDEDVRERQAQREKLSTRKALPP
ncbi:hypothetical protein PG985_003428 [Apiospora marii]|uniref:Uncharacterized protein n=1 Tax=Apiospora marii TaxID=335849 RepID=A0ABR1RVY6_9PEZI